MVALIVTIVVLLILVSITINTVVGDNGIITQAQQKEKELNQTQLNTELTRNELVAELEENKMGQGDGIVGFHPDGGNYVLPTGSNVAKVISEIQLANINSGFDIIEYAWSSSNTLAPTEETSWIKAELVSNAQTITNTQATQGNNYLWVKITDAAEGTSKTFVSSNFNVMNQDDVANKITVTPNKTTWTKEDVNITVSYGDNLPDNRKVGIESANTDVEGNSTTITMTSNGTIYAEATDIAGNKVTINLEISNIDKTGPTVSLTRNSATTNSIKVTATATDAGSGVDTYTFYYKKTSESTYKQAQTGTSNTCTFTGLTQTTNYDIKVVVTDKVGNSTEKTLTSQATGTVPTASGNITFTNSPTGYTNGNVTTTITTSTSYTIQYQVGSTTGTWSTYSSGLVSTTNTTIYARLWDGTNAGSYASLTISNIDKTLPTVTSVTGSGVDCHQFTINATVQDTYSGLSKITWYYKKSSATSYSSVTNTYTTMNGGTKGTTSSVTKTRTLTGLSYGTTYNVYVIAYDVAGNQKQSSVVNITTATAVATIGSTGYSTLQKAFNAVPTTNVQTTVTMLQNVTESVTIAANKNVKLNVNGKTITGNGRDTIVNNGTLYIYGGTVKSPTSGTYRKVIANYGNLTITSGTYANNETVDDAIWISETGTATISGGTITGNNKGITVDGTLNITGGTITTGNDALGLYNGVMNVSGGTMTSKNYSGIYINVASTKAGTVNVNANAIIKGNTHGIYCDSKANININGGTITSNMYDGICNSSLGSATIKITGGTIQGNNNGVYLENTYNLTVSGGTIEGKLYDGLEGKGSGTSNITNGTITGKLGGITIWDNAKTIITGGTFIGTTYDGLKLSNSATMQVSAGKATGGNHGIYFDCSGTLKVTGGTFIGNTNDGICLSTAASGTIEFGNSTTAISTSNPSATGAIFGIGNNSTTSKVYFYNGVIKGKQAANSGNLNIRSGYSKSKTSSGGYYVMTLK